MCKAVCCSYLDYSSTTPIDPEVVEEMVPYLTERFGNPTARYHPYGWEAGEAVEQARADVARLIGARPAEIVWTSGATESNNLAIKGIAFSRKAKGNHIITSCTEHKSVLDVCWALEEDGYVVSCLEVDGEGLISLASLMETIGPATILVTIMHVNHEIGVVQKLENISNICSSANVPFHVDASQAAGKLELDVHKLGISCLSLSSHKNYGPKGVGALFINKRNNLKIRAQLHGGGQEGNIRSGTLPTHQIVGMGHSFRLAARKGKEDIKRTKRLSVMLLNGLTSIDQTVVNGSLKHRVPQIINLRFGCVDGESLMASLRDVYISLGSACASTSSGPSYVLKALGCGAEAPNSLRFSIGRFTERWAIKFAVDTVTSKVRRLRELSPLWAALRLISWQ